MSAFNLLLLVLLFFCDQATTVTYYITSDICSQPNHSCLTLSEFAVDSSRHFDPNTTLIFLPGMHSLQINISISDADSLTLQSENVCPSVTCENDSFMSFNSIELIHIKNMKFIGCGGNVFESVRQFLLQNSRFEGKDASLTAFELIHTAAQIVNSTFIDNKMGTIRGPMNVLEDLRMSVSTGGAIIATHSNININQSYFENNSAEIGGAVFAQNRSNITIVGTIFVENKCNANNTSIGCALYLEESSITIIHSKLYRNTATLGGVVFAVQSTVKISNNSEFNSNVAEMGGVLLLYNSTATIKASQFYNNTAYI